MNINFPNVLLTTTLNQAALQLVYGIKLVDMNLAQISESHAFSVDFQPSCLNSTRHKFCSRCVVIISAQVCFPSVWTVSRSQLPITGLHKRFYRMNSVATKRLTNQSWLKGIHLLFLKQSIILCDGFGSTTSCSQNKVEETITEKYNIEIRFLLLN